MTPFRGFWALTLLFTPQEGSKARRTTKSLDLLDFFIRLKASDSTISEVVWELTRTQVSPFICLESSIDTVAFGCWQCIVRGVIRYFIISRLIIVLYTV